MDDNIESTIRSIEVDLGDNKIKQVEFHHRLLTLEGRFLTLENDVIRTRELILKKLDEMSTQIQKLQTDKLIDDDRVNRNKVAGSVLNVVINTAINAFMLVLALKVAGVI